MRKRREGERMILIESYLNGKKMSEYEATTPSDRDFIEWLRLQGIQGREIRRQLGVLSSEGNIPSKKQTASLAMQGGKEGEKTMLTATCKSCGQVWVGWALEYPEHQTCECGEKLKVEVKP